MRATLSKTEWSYSLTTPSERYGLASQYDDIVIVKEGGTVSARSIDGTTLEVELAASYELLRGLHAAMEFFRDAGLTPKAAATAAQLDPSSDQSRVWGAAKAAAIRACCRGWPKPAARAELRVNGDA